MKETFRYAPSPTGPQHIGGIRTALYCYLMAKKMDGEFILRIEDTDRKRFEYQAEDFILRSCDWLGIKFSQGPHIESENSYVQSQRLDIYKKYAMELVRGGHAYFAFDDKDSLEAAKDSGFQYNASTREFQWNSISIKDKNSLLEAFTHPYVIRLKVEPDQDVLFNDTIRGEQHWNSKELVDTILLKSDGYPSYHLASVVDDHLMGVTHVIRGEEWLSSTPIHLLLYKYFGWDIPSFSHLPLMLDPRGKKFSKRNSAEYDFPIIPVKWGERLGFRELGYLPEALLNYIALLGWNPGGEREFFTIEEMVNLFSIEDCHLSGARFDIDKLNSFQAHYMRQKSVEDLYDLLLKLDKKLTFRYNKDYVLRVLDVLKDRLLFVSELNNKFDYFFNSDFVLPYDQERVKKFWKPETPELLRQLFEISIPWNLESIDQRISSFIAENSLKSSQILPQLRIALTGGKDGPGVAEIAYCLGQQMTIYRIFGACRKIKI